MAKRVMRSNRRTQRRRGSQLKQRKKRSKLLKRTLKRTTKRRNSFRKKNTYKRRKTNMKRGGRPRSPEKIEIGSWDHKVATEKTIKEVLDGETPTTNDGVRQAIKQVTDAIKLLMNDHKMPVYVINSNIMCQIERIEGIKIIFKKDSNCKSFNRLQRMIDSVGNSDREINMGVEKLFNGYNFTRINAGETLKPEGISFDKESYLFWKNN